MIRWKQEFCETERQSDQRGALPSTHFNTVIQLPVHPKICFIYSAQNHMMNLEACVQSVCKWGQMLCSGHTSKPRKVVCCSAGSHMSCTY